MQKKIALLMILASINSSSIQTNTWNFLQTQSPFSFDKALETAYTNRVDYKKAWHEIRASERTQRAAISSYLPQIRVEAAAGHSSGRDFWAPERYVNLNFTQLLYSPAGPIQNYRIARQETRIAEWRHSLLKDQIRHESEIALLDLWFSQEKNSLVKDYDTTSRLVFSFNGNTYKLGLSDTAKWFSQSAEFALAQSRVAKYSDELIIASSTLEKNLGITCPPDTQIDTESVTAMIDDAIINATTYPADSYYSQALTNRKELCVIDETIKKETYEQRFYCKSYFPSVSLYANVFHYVYRNLFFLGPGFNINLPTGWNAGVKLDWAFNGLANVFKQSACEERSYAAMMNRIETMQTIRDEIFKGHAQLQSALKDFQSAQQDYTRAENDITLKRKEFEVGLISPVDLKQAESAWLKAQYDFLTSKVTVVKQYRTLLHGCGYPENIKNIAAQ